jgi:hypothetical protein
MSLSFDCGPARWPVPDGWPCAGRRCLETGRRRRHRWPVPGMGVRAWVTALGAGWAWRDPCPWASVVALGPLVLLVGVVVAEGRAVRHAPRPEWAVLAAALGLAAALLVAALACDDLTVRHAAPVARAIAFGGVLAASAALVWLPRRAWHPARWRHRSMSRSRPHTPPARRDRGRERPYRPRMGGA